jgi:hypothetical protein
VLLSSVKVFKPASEVPVWAAPEAGVRVMVCERTARQLFVRGSSQVIVRDAPGVIAYSLGYNGGLGGSPTLI